MPSPDGCFVQVWDAPQLRGVTDYINGPRLYTTLRDLPDGRIWRNRIHSLKTGVAARAVIYADENFQGPSLRLEPDREYPALAEALSGRIASINLQCERTRVAQTE